MTDLQGAQSGAAGEVDAERPTARDFSIPTWAYVLGALAVLAGVALRFVTRSELWLDEALTVNISNLPLGDLQAALKQDGAPPLYYALLHGWMSVFGTGDVAVRALAGVISVATLPVIWMCGRRLGRPGPPGPLRTDPPSARLLAALAVLVVATSPFAIRYGTESRMYSLVILEVALGYLALRRVFERPSLTRLAGAALIVGAMLYTQYWTIYLLTVMGLAFVWLAVRGTTPELRHAARGMLVALVAGGILFLPWVPTFLYQRAHTGTPWGDGQLPFLSMSVTMDQFANGTSIVHTPANALVFLYVVLLFLGGFGVAAGRTRIDLDLRTQPSVRWEFLAFVGVLGFALTAAWVGNSAFDGRYASIVFPLFVLVVAKGFLSFEWRRVLFAVLALVVVFGFAGAARNVTDERTQAPEVADVLNAKAKPGDVVVYCPDQLGPAVHRLLRARGVTEVTYPSFDDPTLVDWVDYRDRIANADPTKFAQRIVAETGTDHAVWYVANSGYERFDERCNQLSGALVAQYPGAALELAANQDAFEAANVTRFGGG
jgi:hypothetical protein